MDPWGTPSLTSSRGLENLLTCTNCFHVSQVSFKPAECVLCSPDCFWLKCNFYVCLYVIWCFENLLNSLLLKTLLKSWKVYKNWNTSYTGKNLFFIQSKISQILIYFCVHFHPLKRFKVRAPEREHGDTRVFNFRKSFTVQKFEKQIKLLIVFIFPREKHILGQCG